MKLNFKTFFLVMLALAMGLVLAACATQADIASRNVSRAADSFEVLRRITFYNGITGESFMVIEGLCSLGNFDPAGEISVTCKVGPSEFKKHFLGLSDNMTYVAQQLDPFTTTGWHYRVIFNPAAILPDIDIQTP